MSNKHLEAVLFSLFLYGVLGVSHFGWGKAFMSIAASSRRDQERTPVTFIIWAGWAVTLFIFQLIHFALPLNFLSVSPVLFFGIAFSVFFLTRQYRRQTKLLRSGSLTFNHAAMLILLSVLLLMLSAWVASRAMLSPSKGDFALYYIGTVRWINSFHIVPGLGNLHGRLAFNQSLFSYVAALNLHPFFGHGRSIANSFLWLLTLLTLLEVMLPVLREKHLIGKLSPFQWAPALFCIPGLAYWALFYEGLQSSSPDLASSLLQVVMFVIFCKYVVTFFDNDISSQDDSVLLLFLGATAITVKLSSLTFCGMIMLLTFIISAKTLKRPLLNAAQLLVFPVVVIIVFCIRGIILSGAPLYPSTIGYVNTKWSVPVDRVIDVANLVYSWGRKPKAPWSVDLESWQWVVPWLDEMKKQRLTVVYPVGLFLSLTLLNISVLVFLKPRVGKHLFAYGILLLPLFTGLAFWFATAPDPRFAHALFLLLPIPALLLPAIYLQKRVNSKVVICALLLVGNVNLLDWTLLHTETLKDISLDGYRPIRRFPLNEKFTRSGLKVYTPIGGAVRSDHCWDAPLPCTPYFNENLRLNKPNDMSFGFTIFRSID